jgi:hypothetical protein
MLGHIEDKRRKLLLLEKSLLNALCAAFELFEIYARSCSRALVDIREGLLRAGPYCVQSRQVRRTVYGTSATLKRCDSTSGTGLFSEARLLPFSPNDPTDVGSWKNQLDRQRRTADPAPTNRSVGLLVELPRFSG